MRRKISSEVLIMNLFLTHNEDGRRIVSDFIRTQTAVPRKSSTKKASAAQKEPTPEKKSSDARCVANVPTLNVPCGELEDSAIHDPKGGYTSYHPFEPAKSVARAGRKSSRKGSGTSSEATTASEGDAAIAVGGSGD